MMPIATLSLVPLSPRYRPMMAQWLATPFRSLQQRVRKNKQRQMTGVSPQTIRGRLAARLKISPKIESCEKEKETGP